MEQLAECGLVDKVECFVLRDDKLDQMVDQTLRREGWYTWLVGDGPIERRLASARSNHKHNILHDRSIDIQLRVQMRRMNGPGMHSNPQFGALSFVDFKVVFAPFK